MAVVVTSGVAPAVAHPAFAGSSSTFTNMNGGTNFPSGSTVVVSANILTGGAGTITGMTMGGITLTAVLTVVFAGNAGDVQALYYGDLASGAGDTLVVSYTNAQIAYCTACSHYLTGAATGGPAASTSNVANQTTPYAVTLACPSNGAILAYYANFQVTSFTPAWTNMSSGTSDMVSTSTGNLQLAGAHSISGSNPSVTGGGAFASTLAAASWNAGGGTTFPPGASMYWV